MSEIQRVAIVTGAAGGIGRTMTRGLLAGGIRVAGVDRDREPLEALAVSGREQGKADNLLTIQTDLTNDSATRRSPKPPAIGSAASTSLSTTRGSAQAQSDRTAGSAR
jgi:NADP-dependent 3-hydroxy acid dehydrogenase YdfG